ncbi:MAG: nucleotide exchange factor GrpE [Planctomycetota bacterium]|jgi:molecular chaperone GrpE
MSKKKKKEEPKIVEATEEELAEIESPENWKDKYLRTLAELDNMRKRGEKERASARKYALEALMRDLLPVLDSLEFAAAAEGDAEAIRKGIDISLADALRVLQSHGLETIEAHGEVFDPRFHEAIGMRPHEELEPGRVAEEERKGYKLNERVLRPSRVHIVIAPQQPADKEE